jgi:hypothetical protein
VKDVEEEKRLCVCNSRHSDEWMNRCVYMLADCLVYILYFVTCASIVAYDCVTSTTSATKGPNW